MTRRMFAGGMTPIGFVDFFDHIMPLKTAQKRYFLKGASGSGKNTFIKKIAAEFEAAKLNIDFFHCANDATSMDGVAVKERGFSIIDATRPHAHDPEIPAAIDEIIDFAQFLDRQKVARHLDEIIKLSHSKKESYSLAQKLLASAGSVSYPEMSAYERSRIKELAREYANSIKNEPSDAAFPIGTNRSMFLGAITPDGIRNFADTVLSIYRAYNISAQTRADIFLMELKEYANAIGINTESVFCPLEPAKILHLILPEEGIAFVTSGGRFGYTGNAYRTIDLIHSKAPLQNDKIVDVILDATFAAMQSARASHEKIEEIYVSAMDFAGVDELTEQIVRGLVL